jgi:hypothetical protein
MHTQATRRIQISPRAFAAALLAAGTVGIGIGEVASPLAASQAAGAAHSAAAPAACVTFATKVGTAFQVLGAILEDAAKYPPLIPAAEQAGANRNATKLNTIAAKLRSINDAINRGDASFSALKGPILSEEKKCLG